MTGKVGMVYRVEVVQTLDQAVTPTKQTAIEIGNILMEHLPDILECKVEELYDHITLFDTSIPPNETRRETE